MSKPRIYQQANWRLICSVAIVLIWCGIVTLAWPGEYHDGLLIGIISYLVIAKSLRHWVLGHGRRGIKAFEANRYDEAIEHFRASEQFFRSHPWVDKWRTVLAQSTSAMSLLELALVNIVSAQMSVGRPEEARRTLDALLQEFPHNELAQSTLRTWELMQRTPLSEVPAS
jgi:tetratricopeptide (TPR) repeat protein